MFPQKTAILRLLADDDPRTVDLVKDQLMSGGELSVASLKDLLADAKDIRAARHVRAMLGEIDATSAGKELAEVCRGCDTLADLERAAWLLARTEMPGVEVNNRALLLDHWAADLQRKLSRAEDPLERVQALTEKLAEELGFSGNAEDYYNSRNSLLPCVIDSRMGIPISLSLVYMLVADRAGLMIEGINLPGHFIVRHEDIFFDPFHKGRVLSVTDCAELLARQKMRLDQTHLQATSPRLILLRMLANLLYIYEQDQDQEAKARIAGWMRAVDPRAGARDPAE
jgi:regulator of sirC expression with transglutaminase-like and TPR domain